LTNPWTWAGVGAGVVIIVGTAVAVGLATQPHHLSYSVDNWCHASDCPPAN
jgi:hypothetical protein